MYGQVALTAQNALCGAFMDYSAVVGLTPVALIPPQISVSWVRIFNVSATGGPTLWVSRSLASGVAPNTAGAIALAPGQFEVFQIPQKIPTNAVWAVATAADCQVTAEVG